MFTHEAKTTVGILRGGPSPEYDVSLETGKNVIENLSRELFEPVDIYISKDGTWHEGGVSRSPEQILRKVDIVWNALHGNYGEDGSVQRILEHFRVPYTGSGAFASAIAMNKPASKRIFAKYGLKSPSYAVLHEDTINRETIREAYENISMPFIVKPASAGSSIGVRIASSLPELEEASVAALEYSPAVIVEEYIPGKEATCGVIDEWRGENTYSLLPIEIRPKHEFFNYNSKYDDGGAEEIVPGNFSFSEKKEIERLAKEAHRILGLKHYSRSDFIVHPTKGIYILETNTLPGLTKNSLLPKALKAVGVKFSDFLHHILSLAKTTVRRS